MLKCSFGPNLVILAWMADELWCGLAQNGVKFDFQVEFDLEGQGRSSPKTIGTWTKVFCISGPNLVTLAWMSDELSCGQARDWYTHTRTHRTTDAGNDNTQRPKLASGKNAKISSRVNMHISNDMCPGFPKLPRSCPNECTSQIWNQLKK